jgi:bifunctional UDP-N-acetylglucosamine pyrophosphorylase/glucosamine-1-phosphate N-acetyltransferase
LKAWILAAGEGTRMRPLTANIPKPLLPVAGKPFLRHVIEALRDGGVTDLSILIGWQARRVRETFAHGEALGVRIEYEEQPERLGTAHAIGLARTHVDGPFLALNGDIVLTAKTVRGLLEMHKKTGGPVMAVAESSDPSQFGVVETRDGKVVGIEEKPKHPKSSLINAGLYVFDPDVFRLIEKTPKSPRGEYEITDTLSLLFRERDVHAYTMEEEWIDVGRPWDLLKANEILLRGLKEDIRGEVHRGATVEGPIVVGEGTQVRSGADIRGPVVIGEESEIGPNCFIRPSTSIGSKCKVGGACEVKNSIVMDGTHVPHLNYVGDSILGERCNLGAGTKVANLRLDERNVVVTMKGKEVDTGLRKLGCIMGDDVKTGINASIDVGTIIGEGSFIGVGAIARGTIAPMSRIH